MPLNPDDLTLTMGIAAGDQAAMALFAQKFRPRLILKLPGHSTLETTVTLGNDPQGSYEHLAFAPDDQVLRTMVREGLSRMSARHRHVLLLNQRDGYTTKEISRQLGWPEGTVGRVLAEAKQIFKKLITGGEELR